MSDIDLRLDPKKPPMEWALFEAWTPPFSIALDGFVCDGPKESLEGPRANFNHHEKCHRTATRATCAQVHIAIRTGLFRAFRVGGIPTATVFANDCDQDVCLAWTLLKHHHLAVGTMNPLLNRLVSMEDMLDTTAGAYPYPPDLPALAELAWVFEPYTQVRLSGGLDTRDARRFRAVVEDVEGRILRHLVGQGGSLPVDARYEVLRRDGDFALVREIGAQARTGLFNDGIHAFLSVRERTDGRWSYIAGRMGSWDTFSPLAVAEAANEAEGITLAEDRWGGSDIATGSARVAGSTTPPDAMFELANATRRSRA